MTANHQLPVGVLLPTRNSMTLLPAHFETMRPWLAQVEEIVVVDSDSRDGTVEFLRQKLAGHNVRFCNRPPGIYDCWNFGLQQIKSRHSYISTVGDGITEPGLIHLLDVAERFEADVVVSPPDLVSETGEPTGESHWPVHRLIAQLNLRQPALFDGLLPFVLALAHFPFSIFGSAASNLYRTALMQQRPFPTDFGWHGDGAWGVIHGLNCRLVFTPECGSFFRQHRRNFAREVYSAPAAEDRLCAQALAVYERACQASSALRDEACRLELDLLFRRVLEVHALRSELLRLRRRWSWFWICVPRAWRARSQRNRGRREFESRVLEVVNRARSAGGRA